jgi:DeoR/GlpR family transcriptional regulator of sugar metabolism
MHKAARHKQIKELVSSHGDASVAFLAQRLGASLNTIRRDLAQLHVEGHVHRTRGGAIFESESKAPLTGPNYASREREYSREKLLLGQKAAAFIDDGASIVVTGGTTMHALAIALAGKRGLQVVTNGLTVAVELEKCEDSRVFFIGGMVDFTKMATVGQAAQDLLRDLLVDQAFVGVSGISTTSGLAMFNPQEAEINRCFIQAAKHVTVVADSTKFHSKAMFRIAGLDKVHRLVTDDGLPDEAARAIRDLGIELVVVPAARPH